MSSPRLILARLRAALAGSLCPQRRRRLHLAEDPTQGCALHAGMQVTTGGSCRSIPRYWIEYPFRVTALYNPFGTGRLPVLAMRPAPSLAMLVLKVEERGQ
jgi:hypothetical protein